MVHVTSPAASPERRWLLAVIAAGLLVRVAVLPAMSHVDLRIADEGHYYRLATSLVEGRGFAFESGPTSLRPPLYPAFVAAVWTVTGSRSLQAVRLAQIGLALALALIVFAIGRELFGERAGAIAAAITTFYPSLLVSNYLLLTEVLFATLVAAATWATARTFLGSSPWAALAAGALMALAALTRSVVYPLPIVLAGLVVLAHRAALARRVLLAGLLLMGAAIVLAPWAIRNTRLQGVPVLVDTMGGMNLRMGNYEFTPLKRMWDAVAMSGEKSWIVGLPEAPPGGGTWTDGHKDRWARDQAIRFMLSHPGLTTWRAAVKFGDFWGLERDFIAGLQQGLFRPPPIGAALMALAVLLSYPVVLVLAILGLGRLSRHNFPAAWVPLVVTLFVCALHAIVFGHPRYRLPLMPLLAVYAGVALDTRAWRFGAAGWRSAAIPAGLVGGFFAIWVAQFVWRDWPHVERLLLTVGWT